MTFYSALFIFPIFIILSAAVLIWLFNVYLFLSQIAIKWRRIGNARLGKHCEVFVISSDQGSTANLIFWIIAQFSSFILFHAINSCFPTNIVQIITKCVRRAGERTQNRETQTGIRKSVSTLLAQKSFFRRILIFLSLKSLFLHLLVIKNILSKPNF